MTFKDLQRANETIKTTPIKGKDYAQVNQRIKAFRMIYPEGFINTHLLENEGGVCVFQAEVGYYDDGVGIVLGTGHAYEKEGSSLINSTSYIENCETSAVGRALGMAGVGIDVSIASAEEMETALANQKKVVEITPVPHLVCAGCGKPITQKISDFSTAKFSRPLCMDCQKKRGE